MNKTQLIEEVKAKLGKDATKACAEQAVTAVITSIQKGVKKDKSVQIIGFGTFSVVQRAARKGINPQTKAPIKIAASKSVKFKPGTAFKEML